MEDEGGGFLQQAGGGRGGISSPPGDTPRKGKGRNQPLVPLTIKQIMSAQSQGEEDEFLLEGRTFSQASVVGQILNVNKNAAFYAFTLDDGTGQLDVRVWIDQEDPTNPQTQKLQALDQGLYVRAVGSIRAYQDRKNMVAFRLLPVLDFNEITFHFLECIYTAMAAQRAQVPAHGAWQEPARPGQFIPAGPSAPPASSAAAVNPYARQSAGTESGMNPLQQEIIRFVRTTTTPDDPSGVSLADIMRHAGAQGTVDMIRRELQRLQDDGHIFTTVDDEHFAFTGD